MTTAIRVALVGCGPWGQNLLRVLSASPRAELVAIADANAARRRLAASLAPRAKVTSSLERAMEPGVDAVVIAASPDAHAGLVLRALGAGADVFVEKPLALRVVDAERCAARAAALGRVAMVGHLLRYHPTVERLLDLARGGALGRLVRLEAVRLSAASVSSSRALSALWSLGPHDLSVLHALDASPLRSLSARAGVGGDPVAVEAELTSGLHATIALSRVAATKERRLRLVGTGATAELDDVRAPDRLVLDGEEVRVPWEEPLAREIDHFLRCVETRARPRTPFEEGLGVVRALALAEDQLDQQLSAAASADDRAAV